jgi:hypothetical protein
LAFDLEALLEVVNFTYTSLRWLQLAERYQGQNPYPDSQFDPGEFLRVKRLEIGTPNFAEFQGVYEALQETLRYLVAMGGIGGMLLTADKAIDLKRKWIDQKRWEPKRKRVELRKLEADARKAELEVKKLEQELAAPVRKQQTIVERTEALNRDGKASDAVNEYKKKKGAEAEERLQSWPLGRIVSAVMLTPDDERAGGDDEDA